MFRYRGFTEEELRKALKGKRIPNEFIVPSFNSPLVKLAMVDESMAKRFFRMTGINDRNMQDHILRLAKKRPANFSGEEALDIMEDISPVLAELAISGTARCCAYRRCRSWACTWLRASSRKSLAKNSICPAGLNKEHRCEKNP